MGKAALICDAAEATASEGRLPFADGVDL